MTDTEIFPLTVYGSSISYFTGKLENYLRVKGLPYVFEPMTARAHVKEKTGYAQYPAVELADGRWMTDTTPIIAWLEQAYPTPTIMPADPVQRFFCLLLEDYADEWLWRPAMHFRWCYERGARFASTHLAEELGAHVRLPSFYKRTMITRRQRNGYTTGDGITPDQVEGVEAIYSRTLSQLEQILSERRFFLGDQPTLADIGFSGPFFRHFALDPVPAEIMRTIAPSVYEWTARLWNTRLDKDSRPVLVDGIPDDWCGLLTEIGHHYLPYLCANVDAVRRGAGKFDVEIGGVRYTGARWSPYRVWCLARLRSHFNELNDTDRTTARELLEAHDCWEPLWREATLPIEKDFCSRLPFFADAKMIDVYD